MHNFEFRDLVSGNLPKKQEIYYFLGLGIFDLIMTLLSELLYPGGFSLSNFSIIHQGNFILNPIGSVFFNIGLIILGICLIPVLIYIGRHLWPTCDIIIVFAVVSGCVAGVSLALTGIFRPDVTQWGNWYMVFSDVSFGCILTSGLFQFLILLRKVINKETWPPLSRFILSYLIVFIFIVFADLFTNLAPFWGIPTVLFQWDFWEWICILDAGLFLLMTLLLIPDSQK